MKGLTKKQKEVLDFISAFIREHKYPPTFREIADNFSITVKGGYDHIKALEKKKYLRCVMNRSRAIEVLSPSDAYTEGIQAISLLGTVAAGTPLFAEQNFEGTVDLPEKYLGKGRHFALKVRGESMMDAGILEGDIAIVHHQNTADNGDIVVAMVDEAVTLKRFFLEKNRVMLKAENASFPPIFTQNVRILGKLTFLIRNYDQ